ncbi:MAG: hypothetical protein QXV17_10585 [Candidatus Micrarchaeaceae archaeon]
MISKTFISIEYVYDGGEKKMTQEVKETQKNVKMCFSVNGFTLIVNAEKLHVKVLLTALDALRVSRNVIKENGIEKLQNGWKVNTDRYGYSVFVYEDAKENNEMLEITTKEKYEWTLVTKIEVHLNGENENVMKHASALMMKAVDIMWTIVFGPPDEE